MSINSIIILAIIPLRIAQLFGKHFPTTWVCIRYLFRFRRLPNLQNPKDLNEKILFLKLRTDVTTWAQLADKYLVRDYVKDRISDDILIPLLGVWSSAKSIDYDKLPSKFIFKANNGDGKSQHLIVEDKSKINITEVTKTLQSWLDDRWVGLLGAEPHYSKISPKIIAEELLTSSNNRYLTDYKIWCFNGKAQYILLCTERNKSGVGLMTYDLDWNPHPEYHAYNKHFFRGQIEPKPQNFEKMIAIAEKLSSGFPCVRVDLYNIEGKVYFGEMTFTSLGGMMNYYSDDFLQECGACIDLSKCKLKKKCL